MARVIALYQIVLYDSAGIRQAILDDYRSLQFQNVVNGQGFFTLILNENDPKRNLFELDGVIEIKRKISGVIDWYTEFTAHIENFQTDIFQNGNQQFTCVGSSLNGLLSRRIVAYFEGTSEAAKNAVAETVMKEYVTENVGNLATTGNSRLADGDIATFLVEIDSATGITWQGDRSGKNLLEILQEISNFAEIDFQVETNGTVGNYIFRTFEDQLGADRTTVGLDTTTGKNAAGNSPHIFAPGRGNVQRSLVAQRHRKEKNRIFMYGQGTLSTRDIVTRSNTTAIAESPIGLRETMRGGGSQSATAQLNAKGDAWLEQLKTLEKFEFVPTDIPSSLYGVHYFVGDKITVKVADIEADKKIVSVTISLAGGRGESNKKFDFEDIPR